MNIFNILHKLMFKNNYKSTRKRICGIPLCLRKLKIRFALALVIGYGIIIRYLRKIVQQVKIGNL
ncbi:hypothetical protein T4D_1351 [Trichinella pseudospiralis]|uniref:Uncharacterized protein n=1 Tax=Trichinella pseudospiralis TaxID=6337 RepID=A0A0V1G283_TRIPS|nr:hypothetical protein T4D_1351 [Trichinella pseudospiralis]